MTFWDVVRELGIASILAAAFVWLAKSLVSRWLDKDIETHKQKLQYQHDQAIERLRTDLAMAAKEHELRFKRQNEIVEELYVTLLDFYECAHALVNWFDPPGDANKKEKYDRVFDAYDIFNKQFYPKQLYLPDEFSKKIREFTSEVISIANEFSAKHSAFTSGLPHAESGYWDELRKKLNEKADPLFIDIRVEFRKLLGVMPPPQKV